MGGGGIKFNYRVRVSCIIWFYWRGGEVNWNSIFYRFNWFIKKKNLLSSGFTTCNHVQLLVFTGRHYYFCLIVHTSCAQKGKMQDTHFWHGQLYGFRYQFHFESISMVPCWCKWYTALVNLIPPRQRGVHLHGSLQAVPGHQSALFFSPHTLVQTEPTPHP